MGSFEIHVTKWLIDVWSTILFKLQRPLSRTFQLYLNMTLRLLVAAQHIGSWQIETASGIACDKRVISEAKNACSEIHDESITSTNVIRERIYHHMLNDVAMVSSANQPWTTGRLVDLFFRKVPFTAFLETEQSDYYVFLAQRYADFSVNHSMEYIWSASRQIYYVLKIKRSKHKFLIKVDLSEDTGARVLLEETNAGQVHQTCNRINFVSQDKARIVLTAWLTG